MASTFHINTIASSSVNKVMVMFLQKNKRKNGAIKNLIGFSLHRRSSLNYQKLPSQLIKLSVLKLDGSSFSFHVARNASVSMLKSAIEEEFNLSVTDKREMMWPLVWSHFCLCYGGEKLINEKYCIQRYGIRDGDQLHFIQHLNIVKATDSHIPRNHHVESI